MPTSNRRTGLFLFVFIAVAFVCGSVPAQEKMKFPVGVGTKTIGTNMFWLGTKKGFFDEFGLDVQPVLLRGTAITMQALVSESLLLALGSADATIGAAEQSARSSDSLTSACMVIAVPRRSTGWT